MRNRMNVLASLAIAAVLLLVIGADAAAAKTWKVRDHRGRVAGTITLKTLDGETYADVAPGRTALSAGGWVEPRSWGTLVQWYRLGLPYAKKVLRAGVRWRTPYHKGILRRSGGKWVATRIVDGKRKKMASVSRSCPAKYALGAAMILRFPPP